MRKEVCKVKGIERIKILASKVKDKAVLKIVEYLISRTDMNEKYLNEEKSLKQMINFIKSEAKKEAQNGIAMIEDEKVYSWAIHYFDETNKDLGLDSDKNKETKEEKKDKVVEGTPKKIKKEWTPEGQLTLF